ncbi:MAG: hypothetical protein Q9157_007099 [Trypethelium eluteriae]
MAVSRAYDIWSLGCVYLEFITWLMTGYSGLSEDVFFTTTTISGDEPNAEVRAAVLDWVKHLHEHELCSELIHNILDLIMGQMLCINPKLRIKAEHLGDELKKFFERAEKDQGYLLDPVPRIPTSNVSDTLVSSGSKV